MMTYFLFFYRLSLFLFGNFWDICFWCSEIIEIMQWFLLWTFLALETLFWRKVSSSLLEIFFHFLLLKFSYIYNLLREKCTSHKSTLIFLRAENILVTSTKNEKWKDSSTPEVFLMPSSNHSANITTILMSNGNFHSACFTFYINTLNILLLS